MAEGSADLRLPILCLTLLFAVFGALAFVLMRMGAAPEDEKPEAKAKSKAGAQRKRGALDRMQRGAAAAVAEQDEEEDEDDDAADGGRAGRRNAQKEQKRQEKKASAQAERQMRQQKEQAVSEKQQKYSQKQQEKEAERLRQEEAEKKVKDDKEKAEQAEFDQWKEMFAVEAEGQEDSAVADPGAVERFIDYIKVRKVVNLEDLAADFRMRTSVAIDRLKELERLGRISGIFDDRGKFVFITVEEMVGVAEWLKNKGRINRADLVAACNKIVRLNPTQEDKARLQKEASSAVDALEDPEANPENDS